MEENGNTININSLQKGEGEPRKFLTMDFCLVSHKILFMVMGSVLTLLFQRKDPSCLPDWIGEQKNAPDFLLGMLEQGKQIVPNELQYNCAQL